MCKKVDLISFDKTPPLRLVLNENCNGKCFYCHHEGYNNGFEMDAATAYECAEIAETLKIPHISLTGGEPTLRKDIAILIQGIQSKFSGKISLTTNGYGLSELSKQISIPLHTVNLSMTSLCEKIYREYQNVNPYVAIDNLIGFPAIHKNLNIVIVKENYQNIKEIVEFGLAHAISLHIMFELKEYSEEDVIIQKFVFKELEKLGQPRLKYGITPTLVIKANDFSEISIKHPYLSRKVIWQACSECNASAICYERICAVRVYPNGTVSPCLNGHISYQEGDIKTKIENAYGLLTRFDLA